MTTAATPKEFSLVQKLLLAVDRFPLGALWRMAVGFLIFPVTTLVFHKPNSYLLSVVGLLIVLLFLRLIPAIIRKLVPFPSGVRQEWLNRRQLGKKFDSFQWKKLLWIGLGLLAYIQFSKEFTSARVSVAAACILLGFAGSMRWWYLKRNLQLD